MADVSEPTAEAPSVEGYFYGIQFPSTGRPAEVHVPRDIVPTEIIDLALWILLPDGLRAAVAASRAQEEAARSPIELPHAPGLVGPDGRSL